MKLLADYVVAVSIEIPSTMDSNSIERRSRSSTVPGRLYAHTEECERQCPYYYYPICATNGNETRMFVNACEMFAYNCDVEKSE